MKNKTFVGIDGEGIGRFPHKYVLLAASTADSQKQWSIENLDGLDTDTCLNFLADLAYENPDIVGFSYSFGYDITKILTNVPDSTIFRLMRPDERKEVKISKDDFRPVEVIYKDFRLNYFGTCFTVRKGRRFGEISKEKGLVIWDVFKFFQSTFVKALEDWKVGQEDIEFIAKMKAARGEFSNEQFQEVKTYCFQECSYLAQLVHKLTDAHTAAELNLKSYFGAGSTASALLDTMGIKEKVKREIQYSKQIIPVVKASEGGLTMASAVSRAFFGGRFENSIIGIVEEDIYSYDISSAYPYQTVQLPCLEHGLWKLITDRSKLEDYKHALVFWRIKTDVLQESILNYSHVNNCKASTRSLWGPLPFRYKSGAIVFPISGGSGCVYLREFLQAERFGTIDFGGAWVLDQDCDCVPFPDIPRYYNERCRIGKDGPGIVIKLGVNACYGKLAQSVGNPMFASLVWGGMITSGCRAQILEAMLAHNDMNNLLAIATDGIYSREKLDLPKPIDTGTEVYGKPLGGWELKVVEGGMFFARPGVNFALKNPTDAKLARGRGYGRSVIANHSQAIIDSFLAGEKEHIFPDVIRFCGAKNYITESDGFDGSDFTRSDRYGEWTSEPMKLSFNPAPKRAYRDGNRLLGWQLYEPVISAEYRKHIQEESGFGRIGKEQPM